MYQHPLYATRVEIIHKRKATETPVKQKIEKGLYHHGLIHQILYHNKTTLARTAVLGGEFSVQGKGEYGNFEAQIDVKHSLVTLSVAKIAYRSYLYK